MSLHKKQRLIAGLSLTKNVSAPRAMCTQVERYENFKVFVG